MRVPFLLRSVATFGLAFACAYLVSQRQLLKDRVSQLERAYSHSDIQAAPQRLGHVNSVSPTGTERNESARSAANSLKDIERQEVVNNSYHAQRFRALADPNTRDLLRAAQKAKVRETHRGLAKALGLSPAEEERLIELLAEQDLKREELNYRVFISQGLLTGVDGVAGASGVSEDIDPTTAVLTFQETSRSELVDLLGAEKAQRFELFQASEPERTQMEMLRARLDGANRLSDEQESQLVARMQEERARYIEELEQGKAFNGDPDYLGGYPSASLSTPADPASRLAMAEASLRKAEGFLSRIHDQAAAVLSAEQLRRFEEIQTAQLNWERMRLQKLRDESSTGTASITE